MKKYLMMALVSAMMLSVTACEKDKLIPINNSTNTESVATDAQSSETPVDAPVLMATPNPNDEVPDGTISPETSVVVTPPMSGTLPPKPERTHELATLKPTDAVATETTTSKPTAAPTVKPTSKPTSTPASTVKPTATVKPTVAPTIKPTATVKPTVKPTATPTAKPTATVKPTVAPTVKPTVVPTKPPIPEITINTSVSDVRWCWDEVKEEYTELFYDRVIYYINKFRAEEGQAPAVKHTKISQVAAFRAWQSENFICGSSDPNHTCEPTVCGYYGHSHPATQTSWIVAANEVGYGYEGANGKLSGIGEAFAEGTNFYGVSIDDAAANIAIRCHTSEKHWKYVGDEYYRYIGVGISEDGHSLFICVSELDENLNDYHKIHNPNGFCYNHDCNCP